MAERITREQLLRAASKATKPFTHDGHFPAGGQMAEHQIESHYSFVASFIDYLNDPTEENGIRAMSYFEAIVRSESDPRAAIHLVLGVFPYLGNVLIKQDGLK